MDRVRLLQKIPTRLRGTNFCTSSARFAPSFVRQRNDGSLGSNGADRVRSLRKIPTRLRGTNFCTSSAHFALSFVRQPKVPNSPKYYETHQNVSLGSNRVDRVRSLRKISKQLCSTKFCTSSAHFAPSFVRQPNGPECTQIV